MEKERQDTVSIKELENLFDSTTDKDQKGIIAKELFDLGELYYWQFIPIKLKVKRFTDSLFKKKEKKEFNIIKERHILVTIFFVLMLGWYGVNALLGLYYTLFGNLIVKDFYMVQILQAFLISIGVILLFNWKNGFWLILSANFFGVLIQSFSNRSSSDSLFFIIGGLLPSLILFSVLKIKKNGTSTWDYLVKSNSIKVNTNGKSFTNEKQEEVIIKKEPEEVIINAFHSYLLKDDNLKVFLSSIYKSCITENKEEPKEIDLINKYGENIYPIVSSWAISAYKGGEISPENRKLIMGNIKKNLDYYEDIFNKVKTLIIAGLNNG